MDNELIEIAEITGQRLKSKGLTLATAESCTGGGEKVLFSLSPTGAKIDSLKTTDVIRNLRSGNIMGTGVIYTCMSTRRTGNNGPTTLFLINPVGLGIQWQKGTSGDVIYNQRFLDLIIVYLLM